MPLTVGDAGGANKLVAALTVGTSGGNKAVLVGTVGTSGGNKVFYSSLAVSAADVAGFDADNNGSHTEPGAYTATGGLAPYSYATSHVSGATFTVTNGATATPSFTATGLAAAETREGVYRATVTDALGTVVTDDFNVTISRP